TSIKFQINSGYNFAACDAIGIANLEIIGCPNPKVTSSQGNEVCQGEQVLFTPDREYNASSYVWEMSTNGGANWTTVGTGKNLQQTMNGPAQIRVRFDGVTSQVFDVTTIACCQDENGNAAS